MLEKYAGFEGSLVQYPFTEAVYGGSQIDKQIANLNRTTHIVVATPGRLIDLVKRKAVDLRKVKTVILDEADYLNPQSTQPALRGFIEEFSKNCRFIFTCNFANRIISPLHSRCSVIEFKIPKQETPEVARNFMVRVQNILEQEGVTYDSKVIVELITKHVPDWRRILNELQRYSASGTIDVGILTNVVDIHIDDAIDLIKNKNFTKLRKWVVNNMDNDPHVIFRKVYDKLSDVLSPAGASQAVVIIAEYGYKSAFVVDQEINTVACLTEIMHRCEFT